MNVRPVPLQVSSTGCVGAALRRLTAWLGERAPLRRLTARLRGRAAVDDNRARVLHQTPSRPDIAGLRAAISPGFAGMRRGGLFDPLYSGLSASAPDLDAAISRRTRTHLQDGS